MNISLDPAYFLSFAGRLFSLFCSTKLFKIPEYEYAL